MSIVVVRIPKRGRPSVYGDFATCEAAGDWARENLVDKWYVKHVQPVVRFYQDGPNFYDHKNDALIASYPKMVMGDNDMQGATQAREQFLKEFPEYRGGNEP